MASLPASSKIGLRVSPDKKARFAALASAQGLSESALLGQLIDHVLDQPTGSSAEPTSVEPDASCERITLRLRPGDRPLLEARATARDMKPSTYLVALIHAHVRGVAPLPVPELNWLKASVGELSALVRVLLALQSGRDGAAAQAAGQQLHDLVLQALTRTEQLRQSTADLVRSNLSSWEGNHG